MGYVVVLISLDDARTPSNPSYDCIVYGGFSDEVAALKWVAEVNPDAECWKVRVERVIQHA